MLLYAYDGYENGFWMDWQNFILNIDMQNM